MAYSYKVTQYISTYFVPTDGREMILKLHSFKIIVYDQTIQKGGKKLIISKALLSVKIVKLNKYVPTVLRNLEHIIRLEVRFNNFVII